MYKFNTDDGLQAGLIIWGVFIVIFFLIGVPAALSILLGLFAGVAVGTIVAYWRADKLPEDKTPKVDTGPEQAVRPVKRIVERIPLFRWRRLIQSRPRRRIGR